MAVKTLQGGGLGHFEPEVSRTFLPGCKECGGSHPLARKGNHDKDVCPDCGSPAGSPGITRTDKAFLGSGMVNLVAKISLSIGKSLLNLSKRI